MYRGDIYKNYKNYMGKLGSINLENLEEENDSQQIIMSPNWLPKGREPEEPNDHRKDEK